MFSDDSFSNQHNKSSSSAAANSEAFAAARRARRGRNREQQLEIPADHFEVTNELLGKGSFGAVYLADYNGRNAAAAKVHAYVVGGVIGTGAGVWAPLTSDWKLWTARTAYNKPAVHSEGLEPTRPYAVVSPVHTPALERFQRETFRGSFVPLSPSAFPCSVRLPVLYSCLFLPAPLASA